MKLAILLFSCFIVTVFSCSRYAFSGTGVPYLVSVQDENLNHLCMGAIVHKNWVITTGSCLKTVDLQAYYIDGTIPVKSIQKSPTSKLVLLELSKPANTTKAPAAELDFNEQFTSSARVKAFHMTSTTIIDNLRLYPRDECKKEQPTITTEKNLFCAIGHYGNCDEKAHRILVHIKTKKVVGFSTGREYCSKDDEKYVGLYLSFHGEEKWFNSIVGHKKQRHYTHKTLFF